MKKLKFYGLFLILVIPALTLRLSSKELKHASKDQDSIQFESIYRTNPFLQNPINGMTISWFTHVPTHGWIEFGTTKELGQKVETNIGGQVVANVKHHKVRLTNLQPGKTYFYRAGSREVLNYHAYKKEFGETEYSKIYSFKLPDIKSQDFTAIIFNDLHKRGRTLHTLMQQLGDIDYDFVVYNGDCIDDPVKEEHAVGFISYSNEQVNAAEKPVFYLRGNHEIRGAFSVGLNDILDYVGGNTYSAFNWGDTRFVLLDCGEDKPDSHPVYGGLNNFEELRHSQLEFLENERKNIAFTKAAKRVIIHHIPLYGLRKDSYQPCTELWSDVLNKSNISVAINGHTHRFAYHKTNKKGNNYPVVIGGGYKESDATVMVLSKKKDVLNLMVLSYNGKVLLNENF